MIRSFPVRLRPALVAVLLACGALGAEDPPAKEAEKASEKTPVSFVEAFQKGPVVMKALVARKTGASEAVLPLFQVPSLRFGDRLELAFSGEAFDPRVTSADWSLIVVFLPRTVAPTDKGVVDFRLRKKGGEMAVPAIPVPYDSIPMLFLLPDKNGRKKVLADLTAHLGEFRTLCAKIQSLSEERAAADRFLQDLEAIDKNLTGPQYDSAVQGFLHNYGDAVSGDLQAFLGGRTNNLDKAQFLAQEFRRTNVLVPDASTPAPAAAQVSVTAGGGARPVTAYVSIFFDLAMVIHNLWPGHQFQYLPALARNFSGGTAELWYTDWIRTTGDVRGALMCCPGKWCDPPVPAFTFELGKGESLLRKEALLEIKPAVKDSLPFGLFGHDWKLLLTGPKGETLQPIPLEPSPGRKAFVASPGAVGEVLRKLGAPTLKGKVVGQWGFTGFATDPRELAAGFDPAWAPTAAEAKAFRAGGAPEVALPAPWAGGVEKVQFRLAKGSKVLPAVLAAPGEGTRRAVFKPGPEESGPGSLEVYLWGDRTPSLAKPLELLPDPPVLAAVEARLDEPQVRVTGRHLENLESLKLGDRVFLREAAPKEGEVLLKAKDGRPPEGKAGEALEAVATFKAGTPAAAAPAVRLLALRPRLGEVQVHPVEAKPGKLKLACAVPVAPSTGASQVSLIAGKGYRFPADRAFRLAFRNAEDPSVVREVPGSKIQVLGNNQKASLTFTPADLMGGHASGRLEVQVQDDHAGAGAWTPLPPTFLDLPVLGALEPSPEGVLLSGPSLDAIQSVAPAAAGPWQALEVNLVDGREVAHLPAPAPDGTYVFRLFGWPDLTFTLKGPAPEKEKPAPPAAEGPAQPAPAAAPRPQ